MDHAAETFFAGTLYPDLRRVFAPPEPGTRIVLRSMEVSLFPNTRRPGVGLKPRREAQRPLLPQHSRHCPVLEAGSAAGFMVYAPLEPRESYYVEYVGDGRYKFGYYLKTQ